MLQLSLLVVHLAMRSRVGFFSGCWRLRGHHPAQQQLPAQEQGEHEQGEQEQGEHDQGEQEQGEQE